MVAHISHSFGDWEMCSNKIMSETTTENPGVPNKNGKILFVHQSAELYGSDRTFEQSVRAYRRAYPKSVITVLLPCEGPLGGLLRPWINEMLVDDLLVIRKGNITNGILLNPFRVIRQVLKARRLINLFDVTYINTVVVLDFILASRWSKKPCLLHIHEIPTGWSRIFFRLIVRVMKGCLVFNSTATRNTFIVTDHPMAMVISNGTRVIPYKKIENVRPLRILLIGRFNAWKGQDLLVESLALLTKTQLDQVEVRMVGGVFEQQDHFKESVVKTAEHFNLAERIKFHAFVDDPSNHYQWANLVVVPSLKPEPFGLVAIEAMAHGRPVVGADHGGLVDIIDDSNTGFRFIPGSATDLKEKLCRYLAAPELLEKHGRKARARFLMYFQEDKYMAKIVAAIDSLLRRG